MSKLIEDAAGEAGLTKEDDFGGRVDPALSSGNQLLILEFMRPGLTIDWDHVQRFERYVSIVRGKLRGLTGAGFTDVSGYIVADSIERRSDVTDKLETLTATGLYADEWQTLLDTAKAELREFMETLQAREPEDLRLQKLGEDQLARTFTPTRRKTYAESREGSGHLRPDPLILGDAQHPRVRLLSRMFAWKAMANESSRPWAAHLGGSPRRIKCPDTVRHRLPR